MARTTQVLWAATLVALVIVALVISAAMTRTVYVDAAETGVVGALQPSDDVPAPTDLMTVYEDFFGLRSYVWDRGDTLCLWVADEANVTIEDGGWSVSGMSVEGCGTAPFPPAVTFIVGADAPEALRAALPVGTALRLVYVEDDDRVVVFKAAQPSSGEAGADPR